MQVDYRLIMVNRFSKVGCFYQYFVVTCRMFNVVESHDNALTLLKDLDKLWINKYGLNVSVNISPMFMIYTISNM